MSVGEQPDGPVRALIVLPADPGEMRIGGIATFVRSFVRHAPVDFEIAMIGISTEHRPWSWTTIELEGRPIRFLSVLEVPAGGGRGRVPLAWRFTSALLRRRVPGELRDHVVQFHRPATDIALAGIGQRRLRFVHLGTDDLTHAGSESRWRLLRHPLGWMEHRSLRRMDRIYVVNRAVAEAYRTRWPDVADRMAFLPNFYDASLFVSFADEHRDRLRRELDAAFDLPADANLALYAGRLEGQKDPGLLLDAFAAVRGTNPRAVLLVAGEGSLLGAAQARAKRLPAGAVRFLPTQPRERLNELMNVADVFVLASRFETGPTVGYEALATGLPVATTPVGEVARIVGERGCGAVAAQHSAPALAAAVRTVLDQLTPDIRWRAVTAAAPYSATAVLAPVYDEHRQRNTAIPTAAGSRNSDGGDR